MSALKDVHLFPNIVVDPKKLTEDDLYTSINIAFIIMHSIQKEWEYYWERPGHKGITYCLQEQYKEVVEQLESMVRELEYRAISMR